MANRRARRSLHEVATAALQAAFVVGAFGAVGYACVDSSFSTTTVTSGAQTSQSTGTSNPTTGGGGFDRGALLESLADDVIITGYGDFVDAAAALETATSAYASSLDATDRDAARLAWRDAMDVWQRAELFAVGPAAVSGLPGGADLRDDIYSWTLVNRCNTDQTVVSGAYADVDAFAGQLVNVRGLDALEYLLFNESDANTCAPQVPINEDGSWDALSDLDQRRADYASTLAQVLFDDATALRDAWHPSGGNFRATFIAGSSDVFDSHQHTLNTLSDAMFYLEAKTKDVKLAVPTGLSPDCEEDTCPRDLELRFAGHSKQAVMQNLDGFERLFFGSETGLGFDDWLDELGAGSLVTTMNEKIAAVRVAADAIEEDTLTEALASDPDSVENLYFAIKDVTDLLKSDFVSTLDLELPAAVQGDND